MSLWHTFVIVICGLNFGKVQVCAEVFTVDAIVGESVGLPCNTTADKEGDSLSILAWYKNNSEQAFYSRDFRNEPAEEGVIPGAIAGAGHTRFWLIHSDTSTSLFINKVRLQDAGFYTCFADFATSPSHKTYSELNVIEPPQRMWMMLDSGSIVATTSSGANATATIGPFFVGDDVHVFCVSFGGRPRPLITWLRDGGFVKNTSIPLSDFRARSDLDLYNLTRDDLNTTVTCEISNNIYTPSMFIEVSVDIILPPVFVSVRRLNVPDDTGTAPVQAGDPLLLQCRVLGAHPAPEIVWKINDYLVTLEQNITESTEFVLVSNAVLQTRRVHDEAAVTCCAATRSRAPHRLAYMCAPPHVLTVYYRPTVEISTDRNVNNGTITVLKGSRVTLNCTSISNPKAVELIWYHDDKTVTKDSGQGGSLLQPILEIAAASEADNGEYYCAASNSEGSATSDTLHLQVVYPPYCKDPTPQVYGVAENETLNLTCLMQAVPAPSSYRWVIVHEAANATTLNQDHEYQTLETIDNVLVYTRTNNTNFTSVLCWGLSDILQLPGAVADDSCTFWVTAETAPRPPANCFAKKSVNDITVTCEKGNDGGLPQKFILTIKDVATEQQLISIMNLEPNFLFQEPTQDNYKFHIIASNDKGSSQIIEINKEDIIGDPEATILVGNTVPDITTLALSLCGGVALVALCACGLVLCAHAHASTSDLTRGKHPPLTAYNTEESNCDNSDAESDFNLRRTDSFRKAVNRCPSKTYAMRRTSSFHSPRCLSDESETFNSCNEGVKYGASCRVHSMQNICRKRELANCEHMAVHLPQECTSIVPKQENTFYTMPRKTRPNTTKELLEETSQVTQSSDGFSLPPPPDEFLGYKLGTRIKDFPTKSTPTYSTIRKFSRTNSQLSNVAISPLNTVGLPSVGAAHNNLYTYPNISEPRVNENNPFGTEE